MTTDHLPSRPSGTSGGAGRAAQRRRRARRRGMPAGHAILAMLVALGSGTVLNADSLMRTAENMPLGSTKRSVAVGVMRPIRWLSDQLLLTQPREQIDEALGHETKEYVDPFTEFTTSSTSPGDTQPTAPPATDGNSATTGTGVTSPTTGNAPTTATTLPGPRVPSAENPLRVYVAGDSLSYMYGLAMGRLSQNDAELETTGDVDYHVSSGLSRPDYYNWPAQLDAQMNARNPEVVVFMVGSNDDQPVVSPDGKTHQDFTDGWKAEYARRVGAVMDQVIGTGRVILWVGIPVIRDAARSQGYQVINGVVYEEARRRGDAYFVDAFKLFADAGGGYQQYLPNESGQLVKLRANDGIHLERAGGDRLADKTLRMLDKIFPSAPA